MKISIIVPVYNCETYLKECFDSIINQQDIPCEIIIEVIAVDDGSNDTSGLICDEYNAKYSTFKVIHQTNSGVSAARNKALEYATGEYVTFLDGDDILDKMALKKICDAEFFKFDCCYFDFFNINVKGQRYNYTHRCLSQNKEKEIQKIIQHKSLSTVWGGIYRRSLFKKYNIQFPYGIRMGEDWLVAFLLFFNSSSYICLSECIYGYRDNEEGASKNHIKFVRPDALIVLNNMVEYAKNRGITVDSKDVEMARSGLRRIIKKEALFSHLFRDTDAALSKYGNQTLWKDLRYCGSLKHCILFLIYTFVDKVVLYLFGNN